MTAEEACAAVRERWSHPPLDWRDVVERVALRLLEEEVQVLVLEVPMPTTIAARLFIRTEKTTPQGHPLYVSRYVHAVSEVDRVLGELLAASRCA